MKYLNINYVFGALMLAILSLSSQAQLRTDVGIVNVQLQNLELEVTAALPTEFTLDDEPDDTDTQLPQRPLYRTIGGVRLKFAFDAANILTNEEQVDTPSYSWVMNAAGRSCTDFTDTVCNGATGEDAANAITGTDEIYWEPTEWSMHLNAETELTISFATPETNPDKVLRFRVATGELYPTPAPNTVEGSDVAMLEQMLWQLGYGPNDGSRKGNRSIRKTTNRDTFDMGCSVGGCSINNGATTSMEWMIWRFKFANEITTAVNVEPDDVTLVDTYFDSNTLAVLKEHWQDYRSAYTDYSASQTVTAQNHQADFTNWLSASIGWNLDGDEIYTPTGVTKDDLLNAMVSKESGTATQLTSGIHWGSGGNNTAPYRLNQGSADSWASFGFSQIKTRYIYGQHYGGKAGTDTSKCTELNADNPYSPDGAIASIVEYSMGVNGSCGRSFRLALELRYSQPYAQVDSARIVKILGDNPRDIPEASTVVSADGYDSVSKAIGAYNQGAGVFLNNLSWPQLIKEYSGFVVTASTPEAIPPRINAIEYARRVKQTAGFTLRDYIWQVTETRTPTTDWPATEFSYCFTFGETHWGQLWTDARNTARTTIINSNGADTGCN